MLKRLIASAALAVALASATPALAAFSSDYITFNTSSVYTDGPVGPGDSLTIFGLTSNGDTFSHWVRFQVSQASTATASANPNFLAGESAITDLRYALYADLAGPDVFVPVPDASVVFSSPIQPVSLALLPGVNYALEITGTRSAGFNVGNYSGNLAITPIPAAVLLFGPALAGLGWAARRRAA